MSSHWSSCLVSFNLWENYGMFSGALCCNMVLEGYMSLLFLYVAYFPDLGTVGNNDCCCRSNDVGNFFFLFHISLLTLAQSLSPLLLLFSNQPCRNPM